MFVASPIGEVPLPIYLPLAGLKFTIYAGGEGFGNSRSTSKRFLSTEASSRPDRRSPWFRINRYGDNR